MKCYWMKIIIEIEWKSYKQNLLPFAFYNRDNWYVKVFCKQFEVLFF